MKNSNYGGNLKLWVIVELQSQLFALHASLVKEMVTVPPIAKVPGAPGFLRGIINLRDRVLPLVDMRKRLAMPSAEDEIEKFAELMNQRSQDHQRWLDDLETSVKEQRAFTLTTDPHQCAFGKWYDSYKTQNVLVSGFLRKFDAPHKAVHALAHEVEAMIAKHDRDGALRLIERARSGVLATMLKLFTDFQVLIRDTHREIAIVIDGEGPSLAVCVDSIASVEQLAEGSVEEFSAGADKEKQVVSAVGRRQKTGELVLLVDANIILDSATARYFPLGAGAATELALAAS